MDEKNYQAIVTHFGDLGGLKQLTGFAIQRFVEKVLLRLLLPRGIIKIQNIKEVGI